MLQQKETLRKQRDDYDKRRLGLRKELKILKEQRFKLTSGSNGPPSPTTKNFLKDNDKLQVRERGRRESQDRPCELGVFSRHTLINIELISLHSLRGR